MGTKHIGYYIGFRESHLRVRAEKKNIDHLDGIRESWKT